MLLERSAWACAKWRKRGIQATVSIPLLFEGWSDPELAHRVTGAATQDGLRPAEALLLVPEAAYSSDSAAVLENLARLRLEGFSLGLAHDGALDAAGRMPGVFTDLRFPAGLAGEEVQRLLAFARGAQLRTCAQGVERPAQWEILKELGCELADGPFIAPAMHLERAVEWSSRRARQLPELRQQR